jgi:hypothetical protein
LDFESVFDRFRNQGLIKKVAPPSMDGAQKAALNRKGNELFNRGDVEGARRIFLTTGYSDGLIRVGDRYSAVGKSLEALRMYYLAGDKKKAEPLIARMSALIQKLMGEEEEK